MRYIQFYYLFIKGVNPQYLSASLLPTPYSLLPTPYSLLPLSQQSH
ncbi:MAG: hypothetical protein F6K63_29340 [Moorea sp. SIO1G6]|nr:hypothetical protein [Moorena sp. SIO1G6]NET68278.1 hypothetical protein [Moorena sp. SIO1G6]